MEKIKKLKKPCRNYDPKVKLYGDELGSGACMLITEGCYLLASSCSPGTPYIPIPKS
ncbi:hypothetical protein II906_12245 [bacterium]|nr:hypothetical protein [bacterium]